MTVAGMSFHIWDAADRADAREWIKVWADWPQREVYGHPNYVKLYANDKTKALCAFLDAPPGKALYPFLLRDITAEHFCPAKLDKATDIITPYGYGGAFVWGTSDTRRLAEVFWSRFDEWAMSQVVVSEFVRFTLFPKTILEYPGERELKLQNVVRDLAMDESALFMDFKHKVRKNVKKAQRMGVSVQLDPCGDRLDDFLRVYEQTLDRRQASKGYYFPQSYFEQIHEGLSGQFMYFHALHDGRVIATELVLLSAHNAYSFLGGTDSSAFELRPNDLLKYETILWAKSEGKRRLVLGGGNQSGDGIYRYKLSFAPHGSVPFYTGCRLLQEDLYDELVENRANLARLQGQEWKSRPDFFPAYRA